MANPFDPISGHNYTFQIMNEPPGKGNGGLGHTFIVITDTTTGTKTGYGFYPNGDLGLSGLVGGQGIISSDDGDNIQYASRFGSSPTFTLTSQEVNNLKSFINTSEDNPPNYNLFYGATCANWAYSAVDATFGINTGLGIGDQPFLTTPGLGFLTAPLIEGTIYTLANPIISLFTSPTQNGVTPLQNSPYILYSTHPITNQSWGALLSTTSVPHFEPLVINLEGTGLANTTTLDQGTQFDLQNNGFEEQTAWAGAGSGILVDDPTGGAITNGSQLFGTSTSLIGGGYAVNGLNALADLDSNSDGVINSSDTAWSDLRIWVDSNDNGVVDSGELETMSAAGIASISLTTTATNQTDENDNYHGLTATYTNTDSTTGEIDDVSFQTDPTQTTPDTTASLSGTIPF